MFDTRRIRSGNIVAGSSRLCHLPDRDQPARRV